MDTNIEKKPEINVLSRISSIHRYSFMRGTMSGTGIGWRKEMKQVHRRKCYMLQRESLLCPLLHLASFWTSLSSSSLYVLNVKEKSSARQSVFSLTKTPHNTIISQPPRKYVCIWVSLRKPSQIFKVYSHFINSKFKFSPFFRLIHFYEKNNRSFFLNLHRKTEIRNQEREPHRLTAKELTLLYLFYLLLTYLLTYSRLHLKNIKQLIPIIMIIIISISMAGYNSEGDIIEKHRSIK